MKYHIENPQELINQLMEADRHMIGVPTEAKDSLRAVTNLLFSVFKDQIEDSPEYHRYVGYDKESYEEASDRMIASIEEITGVVPDDVSFFDCAILIAARSIHRSQRWGNPVGPVSFGEDFESYIVNRASQTDFSQGSRVFTQGFTDIVKAAQARVDAAMPERLASLASSASLSQSIWQTAREQPAKELNAKASKQSDTPQI